MRALMLGLWAFILLSLCTLWVVDIWPFPEYWFLTWIGAIKLTLLHITICLLMTCFFMATRTAPGRVPGGWTPSEATDEELQEAKDVSMIDILN